MNCGLRGVCVQMYSRKVFGDRESGERTVSPRKGVGLGKTVALARGP